MKKTSLSLCLLITSICACAQKSYVTLIANGLWNQYPAIQLDGDLPSNMNRYYDKTSICDVLKQLSEYGYEIEQLVAGSSGTYNHPYVYYLFSKNSSSNPNAVRQVTLDNEETTEVARYNLQGLQVSPNEKGIQIIVYSNYTTKTIIVQ